MAPQVSGLSYTATGLIPGNTYMFYVQARNAIGLSTNSQQIAIIAATNPETPPAPVTSINGTNVLIRWTVPNTGGSVITSVVV